MKNLKHILYNHGIEYKHSGSNLMICCPFHGEKTPSLSIRQDGWHCFGCGLNGSLTKLFVELGIMETPTFDLLLHKQSSLVNKIADKVAGILGIPSDAMPYPNKFKGITPETLKYFGVFQSKHYKDKLVIPIYYSQQLRGLVKRSFTGGYEVQFYNGYCPFNINKVNSNKIIITEGVFDAFSVYQAGFTNVIASLSASNSHPLVKWLKNINASDVFILYDGDAPGRKNAITLNSLYPDSTILNLPDDEDPNSYTNLKEFLERNLL